MVKWILIMKKLLAILAVLLPSMTGTGVGFAAPFIVSDPDATGASDKCAYQEGAGPVVESPVAAIPPSVLIGSCKIDTVAFAPGSHSLQVWFVSTLWGVTSVKAPFVLQKPSAGGTGPSNLRLVP